MSTTRKQGWLGRQRQAHRGGWRVRVERRESGERELRAERRGDQTWRAVGLVGGLLLSGLAVGVFAHSAVTSERPAEVWAAGAMCVFPSLFLVLFAAALFTPQSAGWFRVPMDNHFPSMSSEEVAAAVEGVEPVRVGGREWRYVPDERVPALDAAEGRARQAREAEREAERVEAERRREKERADADRADNEFLERLQGSGPTGGGVRRVRRGKKA